MIKKRSDMKLLQTYFDIFTFPVLLNFISRSTSSMVLEVTTALVPLRNAQTSFKRLKRTVQNKGLRSSIEVDITAQ